MLRAPFRQHHHHLIVGCLGVLLRRFQNRKTEVFEQVVLEGLRPGVRTDVHVADHGPDLSLQLYQPGRTLALFANHSFLVHQQAVVLHQTAVDRRGRFHLLHDETMPGQEGVEPEIEPMV